MNTANAHLYGTRNGKPGRATIRSREHGKTAGLIVGTNRDGEPTLTVWVNHGPESMKVKVRLWEFRDALDTAIRTAP